MCIDMSFFLHFPLIYYTSHIYHDRYDTHRSLTYIWYQHSTHRSDTKLYPRAWALWYRSPCKSDCAQHTQYPHLWDLISLSTRCDREYPISRESTALCLRTRKRDRPRTDRRYRSGMTPLQSRSCRLMIDAYRSSPTKQCLRNLICIRSRWSRSLLGVCQKVLQQWDDRRARSDLSVRKISSRKQSQTLCSTCIRREIWFMRHRKITGHIYQNVLAMSLVWWPTVSMRNTHDRRER